MKTFNERFNRWRISSGLITPQILVIVLIAAVLRLNHIEQPFIDAFSWRQASTAMMAENFYRTNWNIFYPEVNWTGPGPNYQGREFQTVSYLAALLYIPLGEQDWIGRGVAITFGLWGIFALYQLVRRVWDETRATVSAAVMAVLPGSIFIERSFLPDPAMVALVVTSLWLFVIYLQTDRWHYLLLAGLVGAWGFCTKIPGLIVGLPMAYAWLTMLGYRRAFAPRKLLALGIFGLLTLVPVVVYYLWARHLALSYPPHHFAGASNWIWKDGLSTWLRESYFLPRFFRTLGMWLWGKPVLVLVMAGLLQPLLHKWPVRAAKSVLNDPSKPIWLFHLWLLAFVFLYLIGAKELVKNPWNYHLLNPAAAALAGDIIVRLSSALNFQKRSLTTLIPQLGLLVSSLVALIFLLVILIAGQQGLRWMYHPYAQKSYKLGLALRQTTAPGDLLITMADSFGDPVALYYSQRRGWVFPPTDPWVKLPDDDRETMQLFDKLRGQGATWFGTVTPHFYMMEQEHPTVEQYLDDTSIVYSQTSSYVIYRLLNQGEDVQLPSSEQRGDSISDMQLVTQEIHYHLPEADQVFFVWGYNGWRVLPKTLRPPGTLIKNVVMFTPMNREDDAFVARVQVPDSATIEYVFQIIEMGDGNPIWDTANGQPIHVTAELENVAKIQPSLPVVDERISNPLSKDPWPMLITVAAVLIILGALPRGTPGSSIWLPAEEQV